MGLNYLGIIKSYWKESIAYRGEFLISLITIPLRFVVLVFIWTAVFSTTSGTIGGFSLEEMIVYFAISTLISIVTYDSIETELARLVKYGDFLVYRLQPLNFLKLRFLYKIAHRSFALFIEILPLLIILFIFFGNYFIAGNLLPMFVSVLLAFILGYLMFALVGAIAFWIVDIRTISWLLGFLVQLVSGLFFPLTILPAVWHKILVALPFQYLIYAPTQLYLGNGSAFSFLGLFDGVWAVFASQLAWILILLPLVILVWTRAMKRFSGVGT